jgi:hypothetical protein
MKINTLGFIALLLVGCKNDEAQQKTAHLAATDSTKTLVPAGFPAAPPAMIGGLKAIRTVDIPKHIPKGFIMKAFVQGNLNGDEIEDVLLIAENPADKAAPRQVLILEGQKDATLKVGEVGAKAALCADCGGMMGEPFEGAEILKDNAFRLNFAGGSREKWRRSIDFQYDTNLKKWLSVRDEYNVYDSAKPENSTKKLKRAQDADFVKTSLATFDAEKGQ